MSDVIEATGWVLLGILLLAILVMVIVCQVAMVRIDLTAYVFAFSVPSVILVTCAMIRQDRALGCLLMVAFLGWPIVFKRFIR